MRDQLRAELLKQRSTQTGPALFAVMLGVVLLVVLLHGFGLAAENLDEASEQLMALGRGEFLAVLFAGLLGALSMTSEIGYGTIRPTFLVSPRRGRVIAAKVWVSMIIGAGFGLAACALAAGVGAAAFRMRGIDVRVDGGDLALLVVGGAAAAALWAAIGVGVGAVVRNQVPALIGICTWLLFIEGLLAGDLTGGLDGIGRFLPGAAAQAIAGQDSGRLLAPAAGLILLALYAAAAALAGSVATARRDVM